MAGDESAQGELTKVRSRIELLERFIRRVRDYWSGAEKAEQESILYGGSRGERLTGEVEQLRSELNRMVVGVRFAVRDAGVPTEITVQAPPMIGGRITHGLDVFDNLFADFYGEPALVHAIERAERAVGVYENLRDETGLVRLEATESIDILAAIERALRPSFEEPPENEKEVQANVETILRSIGVEFHREKERAAVGPTTFIPDFTFPGMDLALEVKLANERHGESQIQHELAEDVAGFRTKWKHLIVVVYDCGVIRDPEGLRRANEQHFGVKVLVVKH